MSEKLPSVRVQLTLMEVGYLHANLDHQIKKTRQALVQLAEVGRATDSYRAELNRQADRLEAIKMRIEEGTLGEYPNLIGRVFL